MTELITINGTQAIDGNFNFKNKDLNKAAASIFKIYADATVYAEKKNREVASILATVKANKSYEEDGFKSVAEFAEKTFGIKKANAYALATAGEIYNDATASPALKAFTPSKLAEVANVDRNQLEISVSEGEITPETTQSALREYAKAQKEAQEANSSETKPKVLKRYTIRSLSNLPRYLADIKEWEPNTIDGHLDEIVHSIFANTPGNCNVERIKISKGFSPKISLNARLAGKEEYKPTIIRYVIIIESDESTDSFVIAFDEYITPVQKTRKERKASPAVDMTIEELQALIAQKMAEEKEQSEMVEAVDYE